GEARGTGSAERECCAVQEDGGSEAPEDEVLERRLRRTLATAQIRAQRVDRERHHLQRDEDDDQVRRRGEQAHARRGEGGERVELSSRRVERLELRKGDDAGEQE